MNNKKIIIFGGAGYIGGFLTSFLLKAGYDVTVYDNLLFEDRFMKDVKFIFGDIRDYKKIAQIVGDYDVVVWLAAVVGDGACQVNPSLTKKINTDAVKWLVDNYRGKIIFPSTCSVYGVNNKLIDESAKPNPLSLYAASKLEAEEYILNNCENSLAFRLGTLFGVGDRHSRIRLDLVLNILTMRAILEGQMTVFGGEQWRPLLHVRDVATAIHHGIKEDIKGMYNLSYRNYKIHDLAVEIKNMVEGSKIEYVDMKFEDLRNYRVKNEKFLNTGWQPQYDLDFGIKQIIDLIQEKRIKNIHDPIYSNAAYIKGLHEF